MKTPRLFLAVVALVACACTARAAEKAPALPIEGALKIAQEYLKGKAEPRAIVALRWSMRRCAGRPIGLPNGRRRFSVATGRNSGCAST